MTRSAALEVGSIVHVMIRIRDEFITACWRDLVDEAAENEEGGGRGKEAKKWILGTVV